MAKKQMGFTGVTNIIVIFHLEIGGVTWVTLTEMTVKLHGVNWGLPSCFSESSAEFETSFEY